MMGDVPTLDEYKKMLAAVNDPIILIEAEELVSGLASQWKALAAAIDAEITRRYAETAKLAFEKAAKTDGKVSVDLPGDLKLSASISKRVDWDQDKLMAAAKNMPWADVQHYFKIDFGVSEKIYKALPPSSEFKAKLTEARTEKRGDMKITLERKDAAPADQASG